MLAVVTLPIIVNLSIAFFMPESRVLAARRGFGVLMFFVAAAFGFVIRGKVDRPESGHSASISAARAAE